jgi:hypothetical protein
MENKIEPPDLKKDYWKKFEHIGVIIALLASLATLISLFTALRSDKRALELQITAADHLTQLPNVDGLNGEFTFKTIPVKDLWRLKIQFINTGDVTLIGEGPSSSLITKTISIRFPSDVNILNASAEANSFYTINKTDSNTLDIGFSQWRPGEKFETIIFVASDNILEAFPLPLIPNRPIIDGDINITNLISPTSSGKQPLIDYLPLTISSIGRNLGITISFSVGFFLFILFSIFIPVSYFRFYSWKRKYYASFKNYLINIPNLSDPQKNDILINP